MTKRKRSRYPQPDILYVYESEVRNTLTIPHLNAGVNGVQLIGETRISDESEQPTTTETPTLEHNHTVEIGALTDGDIIHREPRARSSGRTESALNEAWLNQRDVFLDALLWLEGRREALNIVGCPACYRGGSSGLYRCSECFGGEMVCSECCLELHKRLPLHRVKKWNGKFFERTSLAALGLELQFGHPFGIPCPMPSALTQLTVIHVNGIHTISARFCNCSTAKESFEQLLNREWYPASLVFPRTCATFHVLRNFHLLSLQSKITTFGFYSTLTRETDNTDVDTGPERYQVFLRLVRQWRHLKSLKRMGRGHEEGGAGSTQNGELAVLCPACPHPGINLPVNWESAPIHNKFLYRLILAVDANFRLKNKERTLADRGFNEGLSYFVEPDGFAKYLGEQPVQNEVSTCVGLAAIDLANSKHSKGLRTTGVGAATCARHGFFRPNGVVDLQKGERYCNMDYAVFSSFQGTRLRDILISYDIACQWEKKLWTIRHDKLPPSLQLDRTRCTVSTAIPKFHLQSHKPSCHTYYSLNLRPGVGRTDGEEIEREWDNSNEVATSTKEMTAGSRHDTLDDTFGDWNYRKILRLGPLLRKRLALAEKQSAYHTGEFERFSESLESDILHEWEEMVCAWESDRSQPDPFVVTSVFKTQADIRMELMVEERHLAATIELDPESAPPLGPTAFIVAGVEIEDAQRRFRKEINASKEDQTSVQSFDRHNRSLALARRIRNYRNIQKVYMPQVAAYIPSDDDILFTSPETADLFLPSQLPRSVILATTPWDLKHIEEELRYAQATDALVELRHSLCARAHLVKYKQQQVTGQHSNTHARSLLKDIDTKTSNIAAKYRVARAAYLTLAGEGAWEEVLRPLESSDVRPMHMSEAAGKADAGTGGMPVVGEGHRTISWIWQTPGAGSTAEIHEGLRVEWAWCRARKERWREETLLVHEEMRRILAFFEYQATMWGKRQNLRGSAQISFGLQEGLRAYAERQAHILRARCFSFQRLWGMLPTTLSSATISPPFDALNTSAPE